jgi:hypothetical protein
MAMGRKVPGNKNPYTKPNIEQLRSKFKKALPELEFLGAGFGESKPQLSDKDLDDLRALLHAARGGYLEFRKNDAKSSDFSL